LPEDSVSQHTHLQSFTTSLSSTFPPSINEGHVPLGIKVVDQCKVVVNTPECLSKLGPFFDKVTFPEGTGLMFSCLRIGSGPGIAIFGILSYGIYFMKLSILMALQRSNVRLVVNPSNTQAFIKTHSLLRHSVVINHYAKLLNDPPMILAILTFPNCSKNKNLLEMKPPIH
jgi:hypothetical protein